MQGDIKKGGIKYMAIYIRKSVYDELFEKSFGHKDFAKLTKKQITDKKRCLKRLERNRRLSA